MSFNTLTCLITLISGLLINSQCYAESPENSWKGKKAAISLTYDDALNIHLDKVVPALNKRSLRGTFYIPGSFAPFGARLDEWRTAGSNGHELGDHSLFHPCNGKGPDRAWVNPSLDLSEWSLERFTQNISVNRLLLFSVDSMPQRTFAYPCGDTEAGGKSYVSYIQKHYIAARAVGGEAQPLNAVQLFSIPSFMVMNHSAEQMISKVDDAIARNAWLVFLFHGVGGEHNINVDEHEHAKLLDYLILHKQELWVAPLESVAKYVKSKQLHN